MSEMGMKAKYVFLINHNFTVVIRFAFEKKKILVAKWLVGGLRMGECVERQDGGGGVGGKVRAEMGARETKLFGKSHLVAPISLIADLYCIITRT